MSKTLHEVLKAARAKSGLSLAQLNEICGVAKAAICYIESGRKPTPYFYQVARIALALNVDLNALAKTSYSLGSEKRRRASRRQMKKNMRDPEVLARIRSGQSRAAARTYKRISPEERQDIAARAWKTKWAQQEEA